MAASGDGFQVVRGKKSRKHRCRREKQRLSECREIERLVEGRKYVEGCIERYRNQLQGDDISKHIQDLCSSALCDMKPTRCSPLQLIGYGIGPFASTVVAKYHLAFFLLLCDVLKINKDNCFVFDPIFCDMEKEMLKERGCCLIANNEEGKRLIHQPSIFFMPHCGKALYNNLLWANWSSDRLSKIVIIGNSFEEIVLNCPANILEQDYKYIKEITEFTSITAVSTGEDVPDEVFSSTAVHSFPSSKLCEAPSKFWADRLEPVYDDDVEIIQNLNKKIKT